MKKFFLSHWESICYFGIMLGTIATIIQFRFTGWPNYPFVHGLLITSTMYLGASFTQLMHKQLLQRFIRLIHCVIAIVFLGFIFHGTRTSETRAAYALTILIYVVIASTIVRFIVWLYKRHQAKRTPPHEGDQ